MQPEKLKVGLMTHLKDRPVRIICYWQNKREAEDAFQRVIDNKVAFVLDPMDVIVNENTFTVLRVDGGGRGFEL